MASSVLCLGGGNAAASRAHSKRARSIANLNHLPNRNVKYRLSASSNGDSSGNDYVHPRDRTFIESREIEKVPGYSREDHSEENARTARRAFLRAIALGDAAMDQAEACLQIAAEDDALVTNTSVQLPVEAFRKRLEKLANELSRVVLPPVVASGASQQQQLDVIVDFITIQQRFSPPAWGRSALSSNTIFDNPGVYENAKFGYLTECLIGRRGIPALLAIVLSDILRKLLLEGAIDFVARVEYSQAMSTAPTVALLPGIGRDQALGSDGSVLAMCTADAISETLSYLKRSYWPWPWDSRGGGGFRGAAKAFLDGAESAEAEAIARAARHRLERGIWTSPGAGDLRRALAAAERLVILRGEAIPEERRDLAVLYCHAGRLQDARAELKAYSKSMASSSSASSTTSSGTMNNDNNSNKSRRLTVTLSPSGLSAASSLHELPDAVLVDRLLMVLNQVPSMGAIASIPLSLEEAERRCGEEIVKKVLPLTW